jgi:ABC-type nitrate/sulfonate/bicarbonate transport system substrate-binding protein
MLVHQRTGTQLASLSRVHAPDAATETFIGDEVMVRCVAKLVAIGLFGLLILGGPAAAQPYKLRVATVGVPPSMHTLYMQVAFEEGIYRRNGLVVDELVPLTAGPLVTQALLSGRIDVGETDAEGVLNAASASGGSVIAVAAPSQHLSYVIAVQPEIKSLKDLVGKPFAISRPGALSQYLLFPALDREGIARNAVTWVPIGGASERRLALVNNRVKGALLHLDYFLAAQRDAKVVALDKVVRTNPDYPHELLVVRREIAEKQPQAVAAMTRSIIEACRFMVTNRERTIEIYRKYTSETDTKLANEAYDALLAIHGFGVNGGMTRKGMEAAAQLAVENGSIKQVIPLAAWTNFSFQEDVLREIGTVAE